MIAWLPDVDVLDDGSQGLDPVVSETAVFKGAQGLRRLGGPQNVSAPDPAAFRANVTRVHFDHVALEYFEASPHTVVRNTAQVATHPLQLLTFVYLIKGSYEVRLPELTFAVQEGESIVLDSRHSITATSEAGTRVLRSTVGIEHLTAALRTDDATVPGVLPATPLMTSFAAFIATVLRSTRGDQRPLGPQLITAVSELQSAVLAEAQQIAHLPESSITLRYRIEAEIQRHHTDPDLDVAAIARALDISIRHAHGVFNDGDRTIAAVLRNRRVETAALLLRTAPGAVNIGVIARDAGFTDRDVLTRAFKVRYGMTPTEYYEGGYRLFE